MLTFLSTILGHHVLDEPGCLLTTTTLLSAWRPCSEVTNAIRATGGCVLAGLGVTCFVTVGACFATVGSIMGDAVDGLCDTVSARGGALAEL